MVQSSGTKICFCCKFSLLARFVSSEVVGKATPFLWVTREVHISFLIQSCSAIGQPKNKKRKSKNKLKKEYPIPIDMSWSEEVEAARGVVYIKQRLAQVANLKTILGEVVLLKGLKACVWEVTLWVQVRANFSHIEVLKKGTCLDSTTYQCQCRKN